MSLRVRIAGTVAAVGLVAVLFMHALIVVAVRVAAADVVGPAGVAQLTNIVTAVVMVVAGCVVVVSAGAAAYLSSSIAGPVERMRQATSAIAAGSFQFRIADHRRDDLGQLGASIDAMAERLCHLEASRRRLLASVSHELRTPLTIMRGHAFTLGRGETCPRRRSQFDVIDREAERLATLVGDLLSAASMAAAPIQLERRPEDLVRLLEQVIASFRQIADEADVELRLRCHEGAGAAKVLADGERLFQALGNLLANAIAHAPAWSTVDVELKVADGGAQVRIANAGPGIAPELLPLVFEPFVQGAVATGSVGLGLSIVRDLVHAHDGQVHASSRPGRTTFTIELPALPERPAPVQPRLEARLA